MAEGRVGLKKISDDADGERFVIMSIAATDKRRAGPGLLWHESAPFTEDEIRKQVVAMGHEAAEIDRAFERARAQFKFEGAADGAT